MKSIFLYLVLLLSPLPQDIVKVKIDGADAAIGLGEVVTLSAKPDRENVKVQYKWLVIEDGQLKKNVVVWPDGTKVLFAAGVKPKKILVVLLPKVKANADAEPVIDISQIQKRVVADVELEPVVQEVVIGEAEATANRFGLTEFTAKLVKEFLPKDEWKIIPFIAESFREVSTQAVAGALPDIKAVLTATKTSNEAILKKKGADRPKWAQFQKQLGDEIFRLYVDKKIVTNRDAADAWLEIAKGLEDAIK